MCTDTLRLTLLVAPLLGAMLIPTAEAMECHIDPRGLLPFEIENPDDLLVWDPVFAQQAAGPREVITCTLDHRRSYEYDATLPVESGRYLDRVTYLLYDYSTDDDSYALVGPYDGTPLGGDPNSQRGECLYVGGEWNKGGSYTYGRCFSFAVHPGGFYETRVSARQLQGATYVAKAHFTIHTSEGSTKTVPGLSMPCGYESRAGQRIQNCDRDKDMEVPAADIPPRAVTYCGTATLYVVEGGVEIPAETIVAPCQPI